MNPFQKKVLTQVSISLGIVLVLLIGLIFSGVRINKLTISISQTLQELIDRSAAIRLLAQLQTQYSGKADDYLNILRNLVPQKDQLIDLTREFQSLGEASRLTSFGFSFLGETPGTPAAFGYVSFGLNVQATDFNVLIQFIQRLQKFRYLINLDNFAFSRQSDGIQMSVRGKVFFRENE